MQLRTLIVPLVLGCAALPLQAQISDVQMPRKMWVGAWAGMYTTVDNVYDPGTDSGWFFDDTALAFAASIEREISQGLLLGLEGSMASTDFERNDDTSTEPDATGTATLYSGFFTGRLISGGAGRINAYLKGGIGAFGYKVPDPAETNFDFALTSGAGVEYRFRPRLSLGIEWNQIWAYHEKEGLDENNTGRHSLLKAGVRFGL